MKDDDYRAILHSLDQSLRIMGSEPLEDEYEQRIYEELKKMREVLVRAQRDGLEKKKSPIKKRDSRSPTGVQ